jgi:restriction system protein
LFVYTNLAMNKSDNPLEHISLNITPTDYELEVTTQLKEAGASLEDLVVLHNQFLKADDGEYQIDVLVTFKVLNVDMCVLVECKHHKSPIKREQVVILYDKLRSLGAHKGIIYATTKFQSGAEEYATKHGIALITFIDGISTVHTRSADGNPNSQGYKDFVPDLPKYVGQWIRDRTITFLQKGNMQGLVGFIHESL